MAKSKFLIVTPSYNQGQFIEQTIQSVLSQDVDVEYLVLDGKSTDGTLNVLKKYSKQIDWISEKDSGQTNALNKGIKKLQQMSLDSKTNYIFAYINSDDYYLDGALKEATRTFQNNPNTAWVVGEYKIESDKRQWFHTIIGNAWKGLLKAFYSKNLLLIANPIPQPATFIRWEAVQKLGSFNENLQYVMDYEYWLRLQAKFGNPIFISKPLASFRIHQSSKGGSRFKEQFAEQYKVAEQSTDNKLILLLHRLHNWITVTLYTIVK